jgi:hypothetical protein
VRARRERRERERAHAKLVRDRERLAQLRPGGAAERPQTVDSPAQVDVIAGGTPCPLCDGPLRVVEHGAQTVDGVRLRVARVACTRCGVDRALWFRLRESMH